MNKKVGEKRKKEINDKRKIRKNEELKINIFQLLAGMVPRCFHCLFWDKKKLGIKILAWIWMIGGKRGVASVGEESGTAKGKKKTLETRRRKEEEEEEEEEEEDKKKKKKNGKKRERENGKIQER